MVDPIIGAMVASSGASLFGSGYAADSAYLANKETNDTNMRIAQMNLDYQRDYNNQIWRREDNAVQRRAADLEAAGLSKTLAAGSAAGAGGSASAPSLDYQHQTDQSGQILGQGLANAASTAINTFSTLSDLKQRQELNQSQVNYNQAQQAYYDSLRIGHDIDNETKAVKNIATIDNLLSDSRLNNATREQLLQAKEESVARMQKIEKEREALEWDLQIAKDTGLPFKSSAAVDVVKTILGTGGNPDRAKSFKESVNNLVGTLGEVLGTYLPGAENRAEYKKNVSRVDGLINEITKHIPESERADFRNVVEAYAAAYPGISLDSLIDIFSNTDELQSDKYKAYFQAYRNRSK